MICCVSYNHVGSLSDLHWIIFTLFSLVVDVQFLAVLAYFKVGITLWACIDVSDNNIDDKL